MKKEEFEKLIDFYEENRKKHQETITEIENKDEGPVGKQYSEYSRRYSEGFRDAMVLVIDHLREIINKEEQ